MGRIGYGYGSEWQLLRFLGRHRKYFTDAVCRVTGFSDITWLDFHFKAADWVGDGERLGLDFIQDEEIQAKWSEWWPTGRGIMNWDAVGIGTSNLDEPEWILVEAKGYPKELRSNCGAGPESLSKIQAAMSEVRTAMGVNDSEDWTKSYYQHANRLAVLHFLNTHGIGARLVDVLFVGETSSDDRSPADEEGWRAEMASMHSHLGLTGLSELESRSHTVYLDKASGS